MAHPSRMSHAVLRVSSMKNSMDWYVEMLDGHSIFETATLGFMTYDDEHHRLGFLEVGASAAPNPQAPGLAHLAFAYEHPADLVSQYERVRDKGIYPRVTINHGLTLSLYYQDTDTNGIELLTDLLGAEDATAMMHTPYFSRNPIGILMDPEDVAEQVKDGLSAEQLVEAFKTEEVDLAAASTEVERLFSLTYDEHVGYFEKQLAARG